MFVTLSWPAVVLWDNVPKAGEHGHPSVLQLHIASAAEGGSIVGLGKPEGVPKADRRLHTQLSFLGARVTVCGRKKSDPPGRFYRNLNLSATGLQTSTITSEQ